MKIVSIWNFILKIAMKTVLFIWNFILLKFIKNVQFFASIATISMAILSGITLYFTRVDRKEASDALAMAKEVRSQQEQDRLRLDESLRLTRISYLITRSEAGDRFSLSKLLGDLYDDMKSSPTEEAELLLQRLYQVQRIYEGDINDNPVLKYSFTGPPIEGSHLDSKLMSSNRLTRIYAISTIKDLRYNSYVPKLAEMVETEPDLSVLQALLFTINTLFEDNYSFNRGPRTTLMLSYCLPTSQTFRKYFDEMWDEYGEDMLKRKQKKLAPFTDPINPSLKGIRVFDPETEEE